MLVNVCSDEMEGELDEEMGSMKVFKSENMWVPHNFQSSGSLEASIEIEQLPDQTLWRILSIAMLLLLIS